jgi:hypothetical protein
MKTRKTAPLGFLILLIGLGGCSTPGSRPTPGSNSNSISIEPTSTVVGSRGLMLTITGSNFAGAPHNFSQTVWSVNGINTLLTTNFHTSTQLTAVVPAVLLENSAIAQVFVQTGDPMGDIPLSKSTSFSFPVTAAPLGAASIGSISPTSAVAGSPDLTLTIMGSSFDGAGVIRSRAVWIVNGSTTPLATTFVSDTLLTAVVPAALLTVSVEAQVAVQHYDNIEGVVHGVSNSAGFSVTSSGTGSVVGTSSGLILNRQHRKEGTGVATARAYRKALRIAAHLLSDDGDNCSAVTVSTRWAPATRPVQVPQAANSDPQPERAPEWKRSARFP